MKSTLVYSLAAVFAVSITAFASRNAMSSAQGTAIVRLQPSTPGAAQTGHANLSGTIRAGQFVGGGAGLTGVNATLLDGLDSTAFIQDNQVPLVLSGSVGVGSVIKGTNTSGAILSTGVSGEVTATTGTVYGVVGTTASSGGRGVTGFANATTGATYAGYFTNDSVSGYGVRATSVGPYGVHGESENTGGNGVFGLASAASGTTAGVYGRSDSPSGTGVWGFSQDSYGVQGTAAGTTGLNFGVYGSSASTGGRAVYALNSAFSGTTYGVYGIVSSPSGYGVYGVGPNIGMLARTTGSSGAPIGLRAEANNATDDGYGVYAVTSAPTGAAVKAVNTATTGGNAYGLFASGGLAIYGQGLTTGVQGFAYNWGVKGSGDVIGVEGVSGRTLGGRIGVSGITRSGDGYGVFGTFEDVGGAAGGPAYGIYGLADRSGDRAVIGNSNITSGSGYGVFGDTDSGVGIALYASGDFAASGTKAFRIDHPQDPENKYLMHYCAEGPEPMNEYSGTLRTDASGYAWASLPEYFEDINKDLRYQLTVIDGSGEFARAIVSKTVQKNRFQIRTDRPNVRVSWEVKGVRNDRYVQRYGAPAEVDKPDGDRGYFEHPELFGLGPERSFKHDRLDGNPKRRMKLP